MKNTKSSKKVLSPLRVGNKVFIRTVTMAHVGFVEEIEGDMVVLTNSSWVADTGKRLSKFLSEGVPPEAEIEVSPGVVAIGRGSIVDVFNWTHELPSTSQ